MKFSLPSKLTALATATLSALTCFTPAQASVFSQQEVDQSQFAAIAAPFGSSSHQLLIVEQIPGKQTCWSESGSNPVKINPLLLNFNFSGHCRRSTDSNGYSIRVAGQDYGSQYILNVVKRDGEMILIGAPRLGSGGSEVVVGRTYGLDNGFAKIFLDPEWRFTKRSFEGKTLGHVYITADSVAALNSDGETPPPPPIDTTPAFRDITNDIYKTEIEESVEIGFIAGFKEDNTFRPQSPLTREQLVSMVIEALSSVPNANVTVPTTATTKVFPDVVTSRWSAAKIQWAQQNDIVSGYPDGTFRPTQQVKRSELMAVMKKAAAYARKQVGESVSLPLTTNPVNFSDIENHWASNLVTEMSGFCGVATPLNEVGNSFSPESAARRNYAAAATLRTIKCVDGE